MVFTQMLLPTKLVVGLVALVTELEMAPVPTLPKFRDRRRSTSNELYHFKRIHVNTSTTQSRTPLRIPHSAPESESPALKPKKYSILNNTSS